jgi:exopolysaccharide biosynthesis polyprenyl glycosylphosphotransferase
VNATERSALLHGAVLYDEVTPNVNDRTFEILDRRRKTAVIRRRGWLVRRMLACADVIGLTLAFLAAQVIAGGAEGAPDAISMRSEALLFLFSLPGWILIAKVHGLYDHDEERTDHSTADDVVGVFRMVTIGTWLFFVGTWITHVADPGILKLVTFWAGATVLVTAGRAIARAVSHRSLTYVQNTVIVGAGEVGQLIAHKLHQHPEYGINLVGFLDAHPRERRDDLGHLAVLGSPDRLPAIVRLFDIERVIIAFSGESHGKLLESIRSLKDLDVQVDIVPRLFEILSPGLAIHTVEGLPLVGLPPLRLARSSRLLKRTMDTVLSAVGLLLLMPFFVLVGLLIKRDGAGPVFFRQVRMGAGDKTFRIYKFRTMVVDAEEQKSAVAHLNKHALNGGDPRMFKIPDDPRVTAVGRFLRRYSLDELPQLINVFKGEMSLVGPRPLILEEDQHIGWWGRRRLDLRPGVTGLWQVLGRDEIPFEEMIRLDYLYVTTWSLWGDCRLLARTIPQVVRGRAMAH